MTVKLRFFLLMLSLSQSAQERLYAFAGMLAPLNRGDTTTLRLGVSRLVNADTVGIPHVVVEPSEHVTLLPLVAAAPGPGDIPSSTYKAWIMRVVVDRSAQPGERAFFVLTPQGKKEIARLTIRAEALRITSLRLSRTGPRSVDVSISVVDESGAISRARRARWQAVAFCGLDLSLGSGESTQVSPLDGVRSNVRFSWSSAIPLNRGCRVEIRLEDATGKPATFPRATTIDS